MAKIYGQLEKAQVENLTADPTGVSLVEGRAWFRTDLNLFKVYDGAAIRTYIDEESTQTMSNKTLTAPDINGGTLNAADIDLETASDTQRITISKDTKENLDALTRKEATIFYSTDRKTAFLDDGTKLVEIGSGSGVGSPAIYALYNAENEDLTDFTNISIETTDFLNGDFSYKVDSYPGTLPVVTLNERNKKKLNGLEFHYKLTSGTAKAVVKDNLGAVLIEQEISSTSSEKVSLQFYVEDTTISAQLEFQDVTSATGLIVDDLFFTDSPFLSVNLEEENTFSARIENNGTATVLSSNVDFIESVTRTSLGSVDVTFKTGFFSETPSVTATTSDGIVTGTTAYISSLTSTGVTVRISRDGVSDHDRDFNIDVHSQGADYRKGTENLVFSNTGTENTFSARIQNNGTATILSESTPFMQSVTRSALGIVDIVFTPGFFTTAPSVTTSAESVFDNTMVSTAPTTTGVSIKCLREDGSADIDKDFAIIVQRQGTDYKNPNAYAVVPSTLVDNLEANTHAGFGSTNNKIPYYTNIVENNTGRVISIDNDSTLGFSVTVLERCEVIIGAQEGGVAGSGVSSFGISKNSTQLTTSIFDIVAADRKAIGYFSGPVANVAAPVCVPLILEPGDIIRPHSWGTSPDTSKLSIFNITARKL